LSAYFSAFAIDISPPAFVGAKAIAMNQLTPPHAWSLSVEVSAAVVCSNCCAPLEFHRSQTPAIDACGFESYHLQCDACGAPLGGVIDPADDELLLSVVPA
jgi:hypothetical protein